MKQTIKALVVALTIAPAIANAAPLVDTAVTCATVNCSVDNSVANATIFNVLNVAPGDLGGIVKTAFTFRTSLGVRMTSLADANGTQFAVNAGARKGKAVYGGSSNGGGVKVCDEIVVAATASPADLVVVGPSPVGNGCV